MTRNALAGLDGHEALVQGVILAGDLAGSLAPVD
jgi:hypothetical protein